MKDKLFNSLFLGVTILASIAGFVMAVFPQKYVAWSNWWLSKIGHDRLLTEADFLAWSRRGSGLVLFLLAITVLIISLARM